MRGDDELIGPVDVVVHPSARRATSKTAAFAAVLDYGSREAPDSFAGVVLEASEVHAGFTRDLERHAAAVEALTPRRVVIHRARFTERELEAVAARIAADADSLIGRGVDLQTWGPDVWGNVVEVGIRGLTPDVERFMSGRYGEMVRCREDTIVPANRATLSRPG